MINLLFMEVNKIGLIKNYKYFLCRKLQNCIMRVVSEMVKLSKKGRIFHCIVFGGANGNHNRKI